MADERDEFTTLNVNTGERKRFTTGGLQRDAEGNLTLEVTEIPDEDTIEPTDGK